MNILIKNATIITVNPNKEVLEKSSIAICDDKIIHIGKIPDSFKGDKIIDGSEKIVMPGLVNAHTHCAMSLLRNYSDDLLFWEWLTEKIWPIEGKLTKEDAYFGSMLSIVEMIKSGITCFLDMYFFMEETAKAVLRSGMRACLSRGLQGSDEFDQVRFKETRDLFNNYHKKGEGRITVMVAPHAPYTCDDEYLKKVIALAKELNTGIHIHLSESKKEVEDSYKKLSKSPIKHVYDLGLFALPTVAAHCVHVSEEDINILKDNNVTVVNNPGSNLKLANGFAPIKEMLEKGINVALGTDGASSNNNLNMFEEMNLAAIINKGVTGDSTCVPAMKAIEMATINGAKALGLDKEIGSIEVGKKADLIIIDTEKPHFYPKYNMVSSIVYSLQASDVETVIINGNIIMEEGNIKTVDLKDLYKNVKASRDRLIR